MKIAVSKLTEILYQLVEQGTFFFFWGGGLMGRGASHSGFSFEGVLMDLHSQAE